MSLSVADILAQSSNVGAVKIGLEVRGLEFDRWVRRFGFGSRPGSQFPGEEQASPPRRVLAPRSATWRSGRDCRDADPDGAAYSAIANGVRCAKKARGPRGWNGVDPPSATGDRRADGGLRARDARGVLALPTARRRSRSRLYARRQDRDAQKAEDGGYFESDFVASFVGFAPVSDPKLLVAIVVDEPEAATTAARPPRSAAIHGEFALPHLGVPRARARTSACIPNHHAWTAS